MLRIHFYCSSNFLIKLETNKNLCESARNVPFYGVIFQKEVTEIDFVVIHDKLY